MDGGLWYNDRVSILNCNGEFCMFHVSEKEDSSQNIKSSFICGPNFSSHVYNFSSEIWESSPGGLWKKPHSHLHRSASESGLTQIFCTEEFWLCFRSSCSSGKGVCHRWEQRGSAGPRRLRGEDDLPEGPRVWFPRTNQNARRRFKHLRRSHRWC